MKDLKITLAAARVNAGLSQRKVAEALNVTQTTVCKWETGRVNIPYNKMIQLLSLYKIDADNIFLP